MTKYGTHYFGDRCPGGHVTPEMVERWDRIEKMARWIVELGNEKGQVELKTEGAANVWSRLAKVLRS